MNYEIKCGTPRKVGTGVGDYIHHLSADVNFIVIETEEPVNKRADRYATLKEAEQVLEGIATRYSSSYTYHKSCAGDSE